MIRHIRWVTLLLVTRKSIQITFVPIIPTHFTCQMKMNFPTDEFLGTTTKFRKRTKKFVDLRLCRITKCYGTLVQWQPIKCTKKYFKMLWRSLWHRLVVAQLPNDTPVKALKLDKIQNNGTWQDPSRFVSTIQIHTARYILLLRRSAK